MYSKGSTYNRQVWLLEVAANNVKLAQKNLIGSLGGCCVFDFTNESILRTAHCARRDEWNVHGNRLCPRAQGEVELVTAASRLRC